MGIVRRSSSDLSATHDALTTPLRHVLIESGSHAPGVAGADFGLPGGTALRYERPLEAIRPYVPSYAVLDSNAEWQGSVEWMLPGWAQIWIVMAAGPVSLNIRNRTYDSLPSAVLFGVNSRAIPVRASGGVTIAIDVSPLGWARLFTGAAEDYRDQATPLQAAMCPNLVAELTLSLARSDRALEVKDVLDRFFAPLLTRPHRDDALVAQIMALVADTKMVDLVSAAAAQGIAPHTMRRLSKRYFGFPPKLLMTRTRFIRAMMPLLEAGADADHGAIPQGYYDRSHFIRDAKRFLGMTPRQYIAQPTPYADASRLARQMVIGAPVPALDAFAADWRAPRIASHPGVPGQR